MAKAFFFSAVLWALLLGVPPRAAQAADIHCVNARSLSACSHIWISGEIVQGDADKFGAAVRGAGAYLQGVLLSSPGGSPQEAMKIGQLISTRALSTHAPATIAGEGVLRFGKALCKGDSCICASACFLIWAAGTEKSGDKLGIHRPIYEFGQRKPDTAAGVYWKSTMMPRMLSLSGSLRAYLVELSVPERFINRITQSRTSELYWLTKAEAGTMTGKPQAEDAPAQQEKVPDAPVPADLVPQV